jgi:hypothetical protein
MQHESRERNELRQKLNDCDIDNEEQAMEAEQAQVTAYKDGKTGAVLISIKCYFNTHLSIKF